jgi:AAA domain
MAKIKLSEGGPPSEAEEKTPEAASPVVEVTDSRFGVWSADKARTSGYKFLIYGTSGSGKTTLAATFPKPLFLDLEGGMRSVAEALPLRLPTDPGRQIETLKELRQAYSLISNALRQGDAPFETVVIDSLNEMQELVMRAVVSEYAANRQYDDQPTLADYGKAMRDFMAIFKAFQRLPCHVVFISVVAPKQYEEEQNAPVFTGKKTGPEVCRLVDNIGYTFTVLGKDSEDVKYYVSFANTPDHVGKDRLGIGNKVRPNNFRTFFRGA